MPLPMSKRIDEWDIAKLFNSNEDWTIKIKKENPNLYKFIDIAMKYEQDEVSSSYLLGASIIYSLLSEAAKPNKLPVVSQATIDSTIVSFFSENKNKKSIETYCKMGKDDTLLLCLFYLIDTDKLSEIEKDWVAKGMAQFYELLSRQQEADDMEELYA